MDRQANFPPKLDNKEYSARMRTSRIRKEWEFHPIPGTSLVVHWLRIHTSTAGDVGSIPGRGTRIPHAVWHSWKIRKRPGGLWCSWFMQARLVGNKQIQPFEQQCGTELRDWTLCPGLWRFCSWEEALRTKLRRRRKMKKESTCSWLMFPTKGGAKQRMAAAWWQNPKWKNPGCRTGLSLWWQLGENVRDQGLRHSPTLQWLCSGWRAPWSFSTSAL